MAPVFSMIYGFVRQSGDQVRLYSEVGKGTTMCLYFPRWLSEADAAVLIVDNRTGRETKQANCSLGGTIEPY